MCDIINTGKDLGLDWKRCTAWTTGGGPHYLVIRRTKTPCANGIGGYERVAVFAATVNKQDAGKIAELYGQGYEVVATKEEYA